MRDIALIGKARAGKDSVAAVLTEAFGYKRLAFADKLKEAALEINPKIVSEEEREDWGAGDLHLADIVLVHGWEYAKETYPESRRFLQNLGHAMRQVDPDIWIRPVLDQIDANHGMCSADYVPTVVTDCRYLNEAETLRAEGFTLVRVVRPGTGGDEHVSETELDEFATDLKIMNSRSLEDLATDVRWMHAMAKVRAVQARG